MKTEDFNNKYYNSIVFFKSLKQMDVMISLKLLLLLFFITLYATNAVNWVYNIYWTQNIPLNVIGSHVSYDQSQSKHLWNNKHNKYLYNYLKNYI